MIDQDIVQRLLAIEMPAAALKEVLAVFTEAISAEREKAAPYEARKAKDRDRKRLVRTVSADMSATNPRNVRGNVRSLSADTAKEGPSPSLPPSPPTPPPISPIPSTPQENCDPFRSPISLDEVRNSRMAILRTKAEEFYEAYPKHVDPRDAKDRFIKIVMKTGIDPDLIIAAAKRFAEAHRKAGTSKDFIRAPAVWLNKGSYENEDFPTITKQIRSPSGVHIDADGIMWSPA